MALALVMLDYCARFASDFPIEHMLAALAFLKYYPSNFVVASWGRRQTANVIWNWIDSVVCRLEPLEFNYPEVSDEPDLGWFGNCCLIIDGTDVPVWRPTAGSFEDNKIWYSYKHCCYAFCNLIGVHMQTGQVIFQYGPCPGLKGELTMLRDSGFLCFKKRTIGPG